MKHLKKRLALGFMVALLGLGSTGCDKLAKAREVVENAKEASSARESDDDDSRSTSAEGPDYFEDATDIPQKLQETKRTHALELLVYPDYVTTQLQDPKNKKNADGYTLRHGEVSEPTPVKWMGRKPTADDVTATGFDFATIPFDELDEMIASAPKECGEPEGKVTHAILKRPLPFNDDVRWRIYVSGERGNCSGEYSPAGKLLKTY